eukprot:c28927_g2_i1 orf=346-948(+)
MALFGGVVVADPWLSTQFTQLELRKLKSQFESLKGQTGVVTTSDLETGMEKLKIFQQPLDYDEIDAAIKNQSADVESGLDFEAFLRIYLHLQKHGNPNGGTPKTSSSFLKIASTTLLHTVGNSEKKAFVDHINTYLGEDRDLGKYLPIDPSTNQLMDLVKQGVLICKLINLAVPGTIDERAINAKDKLNPWERNENHTLC